MSFVLAPRDEIKTRVKFDIPLDMGKKEKAHLDITWKRLTVTEKLDWIEKLKDGGIKDDEILEDIILNIAGCKSPEGDEVDYSSDLLDQLLDIDYVRKALSNEMVGMIYSKELVEAAKTKN